MPLESKNIPVSYLSIWNSFPLKLPCLSSLLAWCSAHDNSPKKRSRLMKVKKLVHWFYSDQLKKHKVGDDKGRIVEDGIKELERPPVPERVQPGKNTGNPGKDCTAECHCYPYVPKKNPPGMAGRNSALSTKIETSQAGPHSCTSNRVALFFCFLILS